jgi:hypothetical protein
MGMATRVYGWGIQNKVIKDMGITARCRVWGLRYGEFKSHAFKGKWI